MPIADGQDVWEAIVARASNLSERLAAYRSNSTVDSGSLDPDAASIWAKVAADSNEVQFIKRLAFLGLTAMDLPQCLAEPDVSGLPLPTWCEFLVEAADQDSNCDIDQQFLDETPEALPDLLNPLVAAALSRLTERRGELSAPQYKLLTADLTIHLQHELARLVQACVDVEHRMAALIASESQQGNSWQSWVAKQRVDGLVDLWVGYPALARLVGTTMQLWVDRSVELLSRAASDLHAINECFGQQLVRLHRVTLGLSDSHNGHASVADCVFVDDSGVQTHIIYKPKDVTAEALFASVCGWMNARQADLGQPLNVLPASGYGWVEKVETQPATNAAEVELFYRRCGSLAAVLFALGATDCTTENLVANGPRPVVIDAETILQPLMFSEAETASDDALMALMYRPGDSVLDTQLVPRWKGKGPFVRDLSALGSAESAIQPRRPRLEWVGAGTSTAHLVEMKGKGLQRRSDLLDSFGTPTRACDHVDALLAGFDRALAILEQDGVELAGESGPLKDFGDVQVRAVLRMTSTYITILETSIRPVLLSDGLDRSMHLERLARYILTRRDSAETLALVEAEREQMEVGDIPLFTLRSSQSDLRNEAGVRMMTFRESAAERVKRRLSAMTSAEHFRQRRYLQTSLAVSEPRIRHSTLELQMSDTATDSPAPSDESLAHEGIRRQACRVLTDQISEAVESTADWSRLVGLKSLSPQQWGIGPLGSTYEDGLTGVAVAMFAAAKTLRDADVEDMARSILRTAVVDGIARFDRLVQLRGIEGPSGISGLQIGWGICLELAETEESRSMIERGLSDLKSQIPPPMVNAYSSVLEIQDDLPLTQGGDMFQGGLAGRAESLRLQGRVERQPPDTEYAAAIAKMSSRAVEHRLRLGVPQNSPLQALGLFHGISGVLYALAAADPAFELPSLLTGQ